MCLITDNKQVDIATKPITVYKVVNVIDEDNCESQVYRFDYLKDKIYEQEIMHSDDTCVADTISCEWLSRNYSDWLFDLGINRLFALGEGFHFAFTIERLAEYTLYPNERQIAVFELPFGTEYIKDPTGLGISNQIIFKGYL